MTKIDGVGNPFIKCLGGKRKLLPILLPRVPERLDAYCEPFVGGGALFFELHRLGRLARAERIILSDSSIHLIRTYWAVQRHVEELIAALQRMAAEYRSARAAGDGRAYYLGVRGLDPEALSLVEQAARFVFISRVGFNGIWRVNRSGLCNTPIGDAEELSVDPENLRACSLALQRAEIWHADFSEAVREAKRGWFVYGDPPYVPLSATSSFTGYCADGFSMVDQYRLRDGAAAAQERGATVLLSNSSAPAVLEIYREWEVELVEMRRNVSCKGNGRGSVKEALIS